MAKRAGVPRVGAAAASEMRGLNRKCIADGGGAENRCTSVMSQIDYRLNLRFPCATVFFYRIFTRLIRSGPSVF